jgi:hypothetical protein
MNRYAVAAAFLLAMLGTPALAQSPISGSSPPWVQPSPSPISGSMPPWSPPSPREAPLITQMPVKFMITDQALAEMKNIVPEAILVKLNPLKGKMFSLKELTVDLDAILKPSELKQFSFDELTLWKQVIWAYSQISPPRHVFVPSGKPLRGFYKMDAILVGADGRFPFDTGEYNLAGFAGNARLYGTFEITIPPPADVDPENAPVYYWSFRRLCQKP